MANRILDCESRDSTYHSLERILGCARDKLESIFSDIGDVEELYKIPPKPAGLGHEVLFSAVTKRLSKRVFAYDQTCWFHVTRAVENNTFEAGILSSGDVTGFFWGFLFDLLDGAVSRDDWEKFKKNIAIKGGFDSEVYRTRLIPEHSGPFAMLVRDIAFKAKEVGNHDYLDMPEVVQNICICLGEPQKANLLNAFRRSTKPCIVKFIDDGTRPEYLWAALYYLYSLYRGEKLSYISNACFGNEGRPIPKSQILKIEFPDYKSDTE